MGVADVLASTADTGEVRVQLGYCETGKGVAQDVGHWGPWGFVSRPLPALDGAAAMAWYVQDGNAKRVLGYSDPRYADRVGELQDGDSAIVSDGEARFLLKRERDLLTLYTKSRITDLSMYITLDAEAGTIQLLNGNAYMQMQDEEIVLAVNGGGSIVINKSGVHVGGNYAAINTAGGHLGQIVGAIPSVGACSIVAGPTGIAGVGSTKWTVVP